MVDHPSAGSADPPCTRRSNASNKARAGKGLWGELWKQPVCVGRCHSPQLFHNAATLATAGLLRPAPFRRYARPSGFTLHGRPGKGNCVLPCPAHLHLTASRFPSVQLSVRSRSLPRLPPSFASSFVPGCSTSHHVQARRNAGRGEEVSWSVYRGTLSAMTALPKCLRHHVHKRFVRGQGRGGADRILGVPRNPLVPRWLTNHANFKS